MDQSNSQLLGVLGSSGYSGTCFPKRLPLPLQKSSPPRNTLFLGPFAHLVQIGPGRSSGPLIFSNGISIASAVFVFVPNAMLYNALSMGKKTPKIAHSPWAGGGPIYGHRQHSQTIGRHQTCRSRDILAERQTERYTDILIIILAHPLIQLGFASDECILCYIPCFR